MQYGALRGLRSAPHVIVVGSGKGGSGKTTLAMHVAIGLLRAGQRVGTLDLDADQCGLTRYVEAREQWAHHRHIDLELPQHSQIPEASGTRTDEIEALEVEWLQQAVERVESSCDFLVIDTPSHDSYLTRVVHLIADTILTPLRDSFLDLCALGLIDPLTQEVTRTGYYATAVGAARKRRRQLDPAFVDWVVIVNGAYDPPLVTPRLAELAMRLGFRDVGGCAERAVYRRLFPLGLTAFDAPDEITLATCQGDSQLAQQEMRALMDRLQLPVDDRGVRRAAARAEWLRCKDKPLLLEEII